MAVLLLVALPLGLLGAATPYAVRLALDAVDQAGEDALASAGRTAGRLSALATAGSLLGTFFSALVMIPLLGTRRTFLLLALLLAVVAAWGLLAARETEAAPGGRARLAAFTIPLAILAVFVLPAPTIKAAASGQQLLEERETNEQYARVLQSEDGTRTMELGEGHAIHSLWRERTVMTGLYWDELLALPYLAERSPRRVLILGQRRGHRGDGAPQPRPAGAGGCRRLRRPTGRAGQALVWLGGDRLRLLTGDARVELRRSAGDYDAILVDAYRQPYIPFHLSTREFFRLARERLAPGGVVIVNVGHPEGDEELERVLSATMRAGGLRSVLRDPAQTLNTQLVGPRRR